MFGIVIKSEKEIEQMRRSGKLAAQVLDYITPYLVPGVSTQKLNDMCDRFTRQHGAISAPLNYHGFPKSICTSLNHVVCHGIPSPKTILKNGDIINIDITVKLKGYHGDTSKTFTVGNGHPQSTLDLIKRTHKAMMIGIAKVRDGAYFSDIGAAIEDYIAPFNYGIVRDFTGHGIGLHFHEEPQILHYRQKDRGAKIRAGMIFTVEPMINEGTWKVTVDRKDHWTVRTADGKLSAQHEHTLLATKDGYEILTKC